MKKEIWHGEITLGKLESLAKYIMSYEGSDNMCALGLERKTWIYWLHEENVGVTIKTLGRVGESIPFIHKAVVSLYGSEKDEREILKVKQGLLQKISELTNPAPA